MEQTREFERDVVALLYWVAQIEGSFACHKGRKNEKNTKDEDGRRNCARETDARDHDDDSLDGSRSDKKNEKGIARAQADPTTAPVP